MIDAIKKHAMKISIGLSAVGAMALPLITHAEADQVVVNAATSTAQTLVDNVTGAVVAILPTAALLGSLIIGVFVVWRIVKRFLGR